MKKFIAYCRKSTDEPDRQVLSIESQVSELKEFAAKENLKIIDFITESKTAKEPGRKKFEQMLKLIQNGKADGILSWHPDRLARNAVDAGKIVHLLDNGKIKFLRFPTFWFENTPQGKFFLSIAFGQSKYYIDNLSENVKRGNRQKLRRGEWPNKAPFGYLNDPKTKTIVVDKKRAKYVKKAFELFATGAYSYVDIRNFFTKNNIRNPSGTIPHLDKIKRILANPFYYGVMKFCGELYEGKHKPLISKKLFDQVQKVVKTKSRKAKECKHEFDFLGLIKCSECGASITAEKHIKHYKRTNRTIRYTYYRCTKKRGVCSQRYIPGEEVEKQLREIVHKVFLSDFAAQKFLEWAEKDAQKEKQKSTVIVDNLQHRLKETKEKLDRLLDGYLDEVINSLEYQKKKNELLEEKILLKQKIDEIAKKGNEWLEPFQKFVNCALQAQKIAREKNKSNELKLIAQKIGSNFFLDNRCVLAKYKNQGWKALAAAPFAARAQPDRAEIPKLLRGLDSNQD